MRLRRFFQMLVLSLVGTRESQGQDVTWATSQRADGRRICTVDELLPDARGNVSEGWSARPVDVPLFDCSCPVLKSRYFCHDYEFAGYPAWEPRAVAQGECGIPSFDELAAAPMPPSFRVLVYGNSHLRQVVEGIACMFQDKVSVKPISYLRKFTIGGGTRHVDWEHQCRSCGSHGPEVKILEANHCVPKGSGSRACKCDDDVSQFSYPNGARLDYVFSNHQEDKRVAIGLKQHRTKLGDYDMIIANSGNMPPIRLPRLEESAQQIAAAGIPFLWLSNYDGVGDIEKFSQETRDTLDSYNVKFLPVHAMVKDLNYLTRGFIEQSGVNVHFCMPGPPNEIGLLLLRIMWSHWLSQS